MKEAAAVAAAAAAAERGSSHRAISILNTGRKMWPGALDYAARPARRHYCAWLRHLALGRMALVVLACTCVSRTRR